MHIIPIWSFHKQRQIAFVHLWNLTGSCSDMIRLQNPQVCLHPHHKPIRTITSNWQEWEREKVGSTIRFPQRPNGDEWWMVVIVETPTILQLHSIFKQISPFNLKHFSKVGHCWCVMTSNHLIRFSYWNLCVYLCCRTEVRVQGQMLKAHKG